MWKTAYDESEVEYVSCPICGGGEAVDIAEEWTLRISRCTKCGMRFVRRRIVHSDWNYRGDVEKVLEKYRPYILGESNHHREPNYAEILDRLEPYRGGGSLLDIGPHLGFFMRAAKRRGWSVVGVEQSPSLGKLAQEQMGHEIRIGYLEDVGIDRDFDVATFLDVLEHVPDPLSVLTAVHRSLVPNGVVLVKVPHAKWNSFKYRTVKKLLGPKMDAYDAREHINQFTDQALKDVLGRSGFEVLELFSPRPVQTGSLIKRIVRSAIASAGTPYLAGTKRASFLNQDLCVIARKNA